jgi:hypothetical protein
MSQHTLGRGVLLLELGRLVMQRGSPPVGAPGQFVRRLRALAGCASAVQFG